MGYIEFVYNSVYVLRPNVHFLLLDGPFMNTRISRYSIAPYSNPWMRYDILNKKKQRMVTTFYIMHYEIIVLANSYTYNIICNYLMGMLSRDRHGRPAKASGFVRAIHGCLRVHSAPLLSYPQIQDICLCLGQYWSIDRR